MLVSNSANMAARPPALTTTQPSQAHWFELRTLGVHPPRRTSHSAVAWRSLLLVYGGQDLREGLVPGLWVCCIDEMHPDLENWEEWVFDEPCPTLARHSAVLHGDSMYLFGGIHNGEESSSVFILNLEARTWTTKLPDSPQLPPGMDSHSAVEHHGHMVVFGGFVGGTRSNLTFALDLQRLKWREIKATGDAPSPRAGHTAVTYQDWMYVYGGTSEDGKLGDLWRLDLTNWHWEHIQASNQPEGRSGHSAVVFQGNMVMFGGTRELARETNELWVLRLDSNEWVMLQEEHKIEDPVSSVQLEEYRRGKSPLTAPPRKPADMSPDHSPVTKRKKDHLYEGPANPIVGRIAGKAPYPRDGHSAVAVRDSMLVFGGDRYQMPFNDLYAFNLSDSSLHPKHPRLRS